MYQLEEKQYFIYFIAVAMLLVAFLLVAVWKRNKQKKFADIALLEKLSPETSPFKSVLKILTIAAALSFLIISLVNPKMGTKLKTVKRQGVDIVFALDVSRSMLAEDIAPNRLEKSKQLISKIIDKLGSDRVGIIIYAALINICYCFGWGIDILKSFYIDTPSFGKSKYTLLVLGVIFSMWFTLTITWYILVPIYKYSY